MTDYLHNNKQMYKYEQNVKQWNAMSDSHVLLQNCTVRISTFYTHTQKSVLTGETTVT